MSELAKRTSERQTHVTIRRLFLSIFFVGCALTFWQLPWRPGVGSALCLIILTAASIGAACAAPFGAWLKGAAVGAGIAVVAIPIIAVPLLPLMWGP